MNRPPNFDRLAGLYRWMEMASFGPFLWWCRCAFLSDLGACRRALILGDGDGRFTARLLRANPNLHVDAVDASPAMLRSLARRAAPHAGRVRTHLADARHWQPPAPPAAPIYDLVVTHFFLDCLTTAEVQALAASLRPTLSPAALWLVSEFAIRRGWYGRLVARPVVQGLYLAFGWLTGLTVRALPDHPSVLHASGLILHKRRTWLGGLLVSELWSENPPQPAVNPTAAPFYAN
jgi:SAM-dependent methyltransferase